ncbi:hypothetical protein HYX70_00265 [Candidatus Saccharibacteria bacterium]|nr:hypothetical protein [Candidatus Saccharibacteria bacterium]
MKTIELLHPQTKQQLELSAQHPAHAYLLIGPRGAAKQMAAEWLAGQLLGLKDKSASQPNLILLRCESGKKSITIAQVKEVVARLSITSYDQKHPKVVIASHIENLTVEAGNALLKALEEPPSDTVFVLTTSQIGAVLPTIISRTQLVWFMKPAAEQLKQTLHKDYQANLVEQARLLAEGQPARTLRLLQDPGVLGQKQATLSRAEEFLGGTLTQRFLVAKQVHAGENVVEFIDGLIYILRTKFSILDTASNLKNIMKAQENLQHNLNSRLVLENLSLELA